MKNQVKGMFAAALVAMTILPSMAASVSYQAWRNGQNGTTMASWSQGQDGMKIHLQSYSPVRERGDTAALVVVFSRRADNKLPYPDIRKMSFDVDFTQQFHGDVMPGAAIAVQTHTPDGTLQTHNVSLSWKDMKQNGKQAIIDVGKVTQEYRDKGNFAGVIQIGVGGREIERTPMNNFLDLTLSKIWCDDQNGSPQLFDVDTNLHDPPKYNHLLDAIESTIRSKD